MKLWILSDLHLAFASRAPLPIPEADVAVIAGDVCIGVADTVAWARRTIAPRMPVVLVAGNHEFYRSFPYAEIQRGRDARGDGVIFLEDEATEIDGVTFSGCTLWTDYCLDGAEHRARSMQLAADGLTDHRLILGVGTSTSFTPADALVKHETSRAFLWGQCERLRTPAERARHVVVTHHAPSLRSLGSAFAGHPLNPAFASDLEAEFREEGPALWIHGHVHQRCDYVVGETRVICNPMGYPSERTGFDPALIVEF